MGDVFEGFPCGGDVPSAQGAPGPASLATTTRFSQASFSLSGTAISSATHPSGSPETLDKLQNIF